MPSRHRPEIFSYWVVNIPFYCFEDGGRGFITQLKYSSLLEVIFTIVSLITRESSWTSNKHENVYFVARPRHKARFTSTRGTRTSGAKARARDACANRETGLYKKPIWRPIIEKLVHVWSKLDLSNIIRLLQLGLELQQFFYLLVNTWLYSWSKNSRTWHGRSREKMWNGSCEVGLCLITL